MSNSAKKAQVAWIEKVQERLRITSTMLDDMKAVKMLGLSTVMSDIIQKLRQVEIQTSKVYRKLLVWNVLLCKTPIRLSLDHICLSLLTLHSRMSAKHITPGHFCCLRGHCGLLGERDTPNRTGVYSHRPDQSSHGSSDPACSSHATVATMCRQLPADSGVL